MTEIHIPAEVVEAAAKLVYDALEGPVNNQDFTRQMRQWEDAKRIALTALTAALAAWVECRMAHEEEDFPGEPEARKVLILKTTEAP